MHNIYIYIGYHSILPDYVLNNTKFTHNLETKKWLSSLQSLAFIRGLSAYKYKTIKIQKHKEKYENGEEYATLGTIKIECPKLKISACPSYGGITTR